jgi:hypothetical protein
MKDCQVLVNKKAREKHGWVLVLIVTSLVILSIMGVGLMTVAYGVRQHASKLKNEVVAMLAAEAGYEKAIFWMGQQKDMLSVLYEGVPGVSDTIEFPNAQCEYQIELHTFAGYRPVYRIVSKGRCGGFNRTVDVLVLQAISGWDMGMRRVPSGPSTTYPVHFADGEIIDIPIHINQMDDWPDYRDIYISGSPRFLRLVAMGESRYTDGGADKYAGVMGLFEDGICFNQPSCRVTDEAAVQVKVDRFRDSTKMNYRFTPQGTAPLANPQDAVQLEFYVDDGVGKVRITNNCTVRGYQRTDVAKTWDFKIRPGSGGTEYQKYDIYAYHYIDDDEPEIEVAIEDSYVTQSFGGVESEPGGQIYVDGNVIIGSEDYDSMVVQGRMTVVATGNIWIADCIKVSDYDDSDNYYPRGSDDMPRHDNPNVLGLIAQGVIKVVDPGISGYDAGGKNYYPGPPSEPDGFEYVPIGQQDTGGWVWRRVGWRWVKEPQEAEVYDRHLPDPTVVEAAMTVGGGGWGAENVARRRGWSYYGGRKEASGNQDYLIVRGTITEAVRGVVGVIGQDGYLKRYYFDERFLEGILPGDVWLRGKYIPAPAGWHDYRSSYSEDNGVGE